MNAEQIGTRLTAIHTALVEKTGEQPFLEPSLRIGHDCACKISLYREYNNGDYELGEVRADSIEDALDAADAFIVAMPSPEETVTRTYLTKVAAAVDYATKNSIADEYVAPLRNVSCAMTDNLLTYDAAHVINKTFTAANAVRLETGI